MSAGLRMPAPPRVVGRHTSRRGDTDWYHYDLSDRSSLTIGSSMYAGTFLEYGRYCLEWSDSRAELLEWYARARGGMPRVVRDLIREHLRGAALELEQLERDAGA